MFSQKPISLIELWVEIRQGDIMHISAGSCVFDSETDIFIEDGCVAQLVLVRVLKLQVVFLHETLLKLLEVLLYKKKMDM